MQFQMLESIAAAQGIEDPNNQLRLLLAAAIPALEGSVDAISCHLHHRHIPHGTAILRARQDIALKSGCDLAEVTRAFTWWPFYFSGCHDRVPLFAMLERSRRQDAFTDPNADCLTASDWFTVKPSASNGTSGNFSFHRREGTTHYTRLIVGSPDQPDALLFFNRRSEPDRRRFSWKDCQAAFQKLGEMVQRIVSRLTPSAEQLARYQRLTDDYMRLSRLDASPSNDESDSKDILERWFEWQVHTVSSILPFKDVTVRGYCIWMFRDNQDPFAMMCRDIDGYLDDKDPNNMRALDVTGTTRYRLPKDTPKRRFSHLHDCLKEAASDLAKVRPNSLPHWHSVASDKATEPKTPCGLHVLAAHSGLVLYLDDLHRVHGNHAPIYGKAYARLEPEIRFLLAIPLLKLFRLNCKSDGHVWKSIGTVSIASTRVGAIDPGDASFLACLLNLGCFRTCQSSDSYVDVTGSPLALREVTDLTLPTNYRPATYS
jgi:hypothetical protein